MVFSARCWLAGRVKVCVMHALIADTTWNQTILSLLMIVI